MLRSLAAGLALFAAILAGTSIASAQSSPMLGGNLATVFRSGNVFHIRACAGADRRGFVRCHAHIVSDSAGRFLVVPFRTNAQPSGYNPTQLRAAYGITGSGSSSTIVAVVDAYDYPNAATDLATYRSTFGLPACPSGSCFIKYNERGSTSSFPRFNLGWAQEMALDLQMVSAMCPNCKIILVEANSDGNSDLAAAVNTAASLGAHAIGNSYGGPEAGTQSSESAYNHAGVAVTASTGDTGYGAGPQFPATSPHVIAVGGTSLYQSNGARGWSETAWIDGGSGCSTIYGKPTWQNSVDNFCPNRTEADVAAVGDPSTGVAVYAPYTSSKSEWLIFGGTSASAQIISGIYGVNGGAVSYGSNPYSNASALNDITSGTNGRCSGSLICTAAPGYDGPTGMGTPKNATGF